MTDFATLLSPATNFSVVQLPGRKFPGVVVQGDTLNSLVSSIQRIEQSCADACAKDELGLILEQLTEAKEFYELVCKNRGIPLPY